MDRSGLVMRISAPLVDRVLAAPIDPSIAWEGYIDQIKSVRAHNAQTTHIGAEHPRLAWLLHRFVRDMKCTRVLELGVQSGGSAYGVLTALPEGGLYVGIDNEMDAHATYGGCGVKEIGVCRKVIIMGDAREIVPRLRWGVWDLIHIDHYKEYYLHELEALIATRQIGRNTVVIFHDIEGMAAFCWLDCQSYFINVRQVPGAIIENGVGICWGVR